MGRSAILSLVVLFLAPAIAAASRGPSRLSANLTESCHELTWGIPLLDVLGRDSIDFPLSPEDAAIGARDPRALKAEALFRAIERTSLVPKPETPFFDVITNPMIAVAWNPWVWSKIPAAKARRPSVYLSLFQWFTGMAPYFDATRFTEFPPIGGLGIDDLPALTQGKFDAALDAFFSDERIHAALASDPARFAPNATALSPERLASSLTAPYRDPDDTDDIDFSDVTLPAMTAACAALRPLDAVDCGKSAYAQAERLLTGGARSLGGKFLVPILTTVDPRVGEASLAIARKVLARFRAGDASGSIFDDALAEFREVGFDPNEADEWAWQFVMLAYSHGQNTGVELRTRGYVQTYNFWSIFSADFVSAASAYLDSIRGRENPGLYSIPSSVVSTSCDNGKPYHFWVAAMSAREARRIGDSAAAARWGAYVLEVGYEIFSKTFGRDPIRDLREGRYSTWNARNRLDLSYAAAGAAYGSLAGAGRVPAKPYVIDRAYRDLYRAGGRWTPLPDSLWDWVVDHPGRAAKAAQAEQWLRMMRPAAGLEAFESRGADAAD